jgi:hypothetical protein
MRLPSQSRSGKTAPKADTCYLYAPLTGSNSEVSKSVASPHLFQNATSTLPGTLLTFVTFSNQT